MPLLYLMLAVVGLIFFGVAGGGALVAGLYGYRLNRYRYQFMGLADRRFFLPRLWRLWKFSLYQPVVCIALALFVVTILSLILKPLVVAKVFGDGGESEAALQVGTWENKLFALTEWLKDGQLLDAFLAITLTLLFINLLWPSLKIFNEAPRLRTTIRKLMIFLTTLSAFTFVSGKSINQNRAIITANLRKEIIKNDEEINHFNSESAAFKIVKESIDKLTPEQIRQLSALVKTVAAVESAKTISEEMGKEAGDKLKKDYKIEESKSLSKVRSPSPLDEIEDWPSLAERRAESSKQVKRAALLKKAARESMLASLDKLSLDVVDHLGSSMSRLSKVVLGSFFSAMTESVSEFCSSLSPGKRLNSGDDILKHIELNHPQMTTERFFASWLDDIPDADDPHKMVGAFSKRVTAIDADIKLKSAVRASKAAADAAGAAKAAKAAKSLIKIIF